MKIAIEAEQAAVPRKTGLGVYVDSLLREFARSAPPDFEFYLLHTRPRWNGEDYGPRFHPVSYRFGRLHSAAILLRLNSVLKEIGADLFHATCTNGIPPHCCCPSVVTVHDLFPLTVPGTPFVQKAFFRLLFGITRREADYFICNSRFTQSELCKSGIPEAKTGVIHLAPQTHFTPDMRIQPEKPFYLCVGALEYRKGQLILAEAYRAACTDEPELPDLYFVGPDRGDGAAMKEYTRICPKIHWLDYVSQNDLENMYLSASLFLLPSRTEGFGLPLLEALQAGTPVICSDIPVFHELGGDAVTYAGTDADSFAKALLHFFRNGSALSPEKAFQHSQLFTWRNCACSTVKAYQGLIRTGS